MKISKYFLVIACGALVTTGFVCAMDNKLIEKIERLRENIPRRLSYMVAPENESTFKAVGVVRQVAKDVVSALALKHSRYRIEKRALNAPKRLCKWASDIRDDGVIRGLDESKEIAAAYDKDITIGIWAVSDQAPKPKPFYDEHARDCMCGRCYRRSEHVPLKEQGILLDMMSLKMLTPWGIAPIFCADIQGNEFPFAMAIRAALFQKLGLRFSRIGKLGQELRRNHFKSKKRQCDVYKLREGIDPHLLYTKDYCDFFGMYSEDPLLNKMAPDEVSKEQLADDEKVSASDQKKSPLIICQSPLIISESTDEQDESCEEGSLYELTRLGDITIPEHYVGNCLPFMEWRNKDTCEEFASFFGGTPEDHRKLDASEIKEAADCAWKVWQLRLNGKFLENQ